MELPRALWPWQQTLSIFPRDLAIALGGIVDKLALLVGPLVSPDASGRDQPDGIDGVGRRGSFERLLTTEWALAEEAPLEFLRRVSTGELSFLEIAHKKPTVARHCVALFDVGPDQHGSPRLVHLAALILLAQRAQAGGAQFSWGILQDPSAELLADVNEESVRRLLQPGSARRVSIEDVIKFYQTLQDDEAEVWLISSSRTCSAMDNIGAARIEIEDSLDPEAPFDLEVTVFGDKRKPRSVRLQLPESRAAVRLLRDPFRVAKATPQKSSLRLAPDTNLLFSRDNRKLFLLGASGELVTIPIPNSPNSTQAPKPRIFRAPEGESILGVGRLNGRRAVVVATTQREQFYLHELSTQLRASAHRREFQLKIPESGELPPTPLVSAESSRKVMPLGQLIQMEKDGLLLFHNNHDVLLQFDKNDLSLLEYPVSAVQQTITTTSWLRHRNPPSMAIYRGTVPSSVELPPETIDVRMTPSGTIVAQIAPTVWRVQEGQEQWSPPIHLPAGYEVIGVNYTKNIVFYALDETRKNILCIDGETRDTCFTTSSPIRSVNAPVGCWQIAALTENDELLVYSRDDKRFLLRMQLGEA